MATRKNARLKNRLQELCDRAGTSPAEVSKTINRAQSALSQIKNGERAPCPDILVRLYDEYGWQPGDLLYVEPNDKSP